LCIPTFYELWIPLSKKNEPLFRQVYIKDGMVYAHAPASVLRQILALRIHLDDSTAHNGLLRVLQGTQTMAF
jgi:hypothetical protein